MSGDKIGRLAPYSRFAAYTGETRGSNDELGSAHDLQYPGEPIMTRSRSRLSNPMRTQAILVEMTEPGQTRPSFQGGGGGGSAKSRILGATNNTLSSGWDPLQT